MKAKAVEMTDGVQRYYALEVESASGTKFILRMPQEQYFTVNDELMALYKEELPELRNHKSKSMLALFSALARRLTD